MRLTTKSRYGTRLILDLALYGKDTPVPLSDVSKRQNISLKYLEQLIGKLKRDGLINSQRGASGGYLLAKTTEDISVGDIVRCLEGITAITDCSEEDKKLCSVCNRAGDCLSRWVWIEASKAMFDCLDSISINDIINRNRNDIAIKKLYC
ncbi:MAG: RrF2 family transcriptional regulator [Desulfamplus sp.]|nr:RrF2 family transcriptional regulator [Desulfamplus sp.]